MFKLLSKESNIFSVPVYLFFLLVIISYFNILNFNTISLISAIIAFIGISLGYFLFNNINLTYQTHLPLFLYTFFVFALYPGFLDIGIAVSLFTNSFLLILLTNTDESIKKDSYVLVGSILMINFIFLPTTFPLVFFVILHILGSSERIGLDIFRLTFGIVLITLAYFSIAFYLGFNEWDPAYFFINNIKPVKDFSTIYYLIPVMLMLVYSVFDHFTNFSKKSPTSRFKYTFILVFTISQLTSIIFFMGKNYEYLLLMAFPTSIILSRMMRFLSKYWIKELCLWLILFSLLAYKIALYLKL